MACATMMEVTIDPSRNLPLPTEKYLMYTESGTRPVKKAEQWLDNWVSYHSET